MTFREERIKRLKEVAQDIIDNAENIVDENIDHVFDFDIWIKLPWDGPASYEVTKEYMVTPND